MFHIAALGRMLQRTTTRCLWAQDAETQVRALYVISCAGNLTEENSCVFELPRGRIQGVSRL
jgi:hypothetical protein